MPKHPVVRGHPVHAALSDLPATLVPVALLFAVAERLRSTEGTRFAARATHALALAGALAASAAGWWDWTTMPRDWKAWRRATLHGALNTLGTAAVALALVPRRRLVMLGAGTAAMLAGSLLGGELVFRHGWRVRPAEEIEIVEAELRRDHLERYLERAREAVEDFERRETYLPASG